MLDSILDGVASVVNTINPLQYLKEGAARDEARSVRAQDRMDIQNQASIDNSFRERALAKGVQSNGATVGAIGQDSSYVSPHMGQNIGSSSDRKMAALNQRTVELQNEGLALDNLQKSQTLNKTPTKPTGQPVRGTGFMPGSSQGTTILNKPQERTASLNGYSEPGAVASLGYTTFPDGSVMVTPSDNLKTKIEDDVIGEAAFHLNARTPLSTPPKSALPNWADMWKWNPITNVFTPDKSTLNDAYKKTKKFMKYKFRKVKNENPLRGGETIEGYFE